MERDNSIYLQHIRDAISTIEGYLRGVNEETFRTNKLLQDGIIRQLGVIGEAARHVSRSLQEKYPQIPWEDVIGMRDKLIHDYFGVDLQNVWLTATQDVPSLKTHIQQMLDEL